MGSKNNNWHTEFGLGETAESTLARQLSCVCVCACVGACAYLGAHMCINFPRKGMRLWETQSGSSPGKISSVAMHNIRRYSFRSRNLLETCTCGQLPHFCVTLPRCCARWISVLGEYPKLHLLCRGLTCVSLSGIVKELVAMYQLVEYSGACNNF